MLFPELLLFSVSLYYQYW